MENLEICSKNVKYFKMLFLSDRNCFFLALKNNRMIFFGGMLQKHVDPIYDAVNKISTKLKVNIQNCIT